MDYQALMFVQGGRLHAIKVSIPSRQQAVELLHQFLAGDIPEDCLLSTAIQRIMATCS
jgi:hypothetical protein